MSKRIFLTVFLGFFISLLILSVVAFAADNSITIKGSTTLLPIAQRTAEVFMDKNPNINISVQGGGSGVGIASIIDGTCDIGDASRPIKDTELEKAASFGKEPKANVVAMDGIAAIVNSSNPVTALKKKQLKDIYTGKISNWKDIGGEDKKIVVISRDSASGTFEAFGELALNKEKVRPDALLQASNNAVASTVANTPGAIGYVGLGFITSDVKALKLDGVVPSKNTVLSGEYVLARPLFMYTNGKPKGVVKEYIDFVLSSEGQKIAEEEGYVGLK